MVSRKKLNFRIIEISDEERGYEEKFEDFKKDYLNPFTSKVDLLEKYELPVRIYNEFLERIRKETGLDKKPTRRPMGSPMTYIYKTKYRWGIRKQDSYTGEMKYYGYYDDLDTAKMVRDKLYYSDWNDELANELVEKYNVGKYCPNQLEIDEKYESFKDLYMNHDLSYLEIRNKLDLNGYMYMKLLKILREEIPNVKKHRKAIDVSDRPMRYIGKCSGGYNILKHIDGEMKYFGWFRRLEDAVNRRNYLETHDWVMP